MSAMLKKIDEQIVQQIVDRLVQVLHPQEIYVFGSQATGKTHAHSDLDLLIVVDDDAGDLHELAGRAYSAVADIALPKDLVFYRRQSMEKWAPVKFSLPYEATHKGRLVYAA